MARARVQTAAAPTVRHRVRGEPMVAMRSTRRLAPFVALFATLLVVIGGGAPSALAHDSTHRSTVVEVNDRRVIVTATVPFAELGYVDTSGDGLIDAEEVARQEADVAPMLVEVARDHVELSIDGEVVEIIGAGVPSSSEPDGSDHEASPYVTLVLASGPHDGDVADVELGWDFFVPTTTVVLAHADGAVTGTLGDDNSISFSLDAISSATSFFELGVDHIRSGPDHLLFLLVLTLAVAGTAVNADTTKRTVQLVTAFTLGHAVSLALAYFDLISIPAWVVEPAISLSIVAAAVLAIRGARQRRTTVDCGPRRPDSRLGLRIESRQSRRRDLAAVRCPRCVQLRYRCRPDRVRPADHRGALPVRPGDGTARGVGPCGRRCRCRRVRHCMDCISSRRTAGIGRAARPPPGRSHRNGQRTPSAEDAAVAVRRVEWLT